MERSILPATHEIIPVSMLLHQTIQARCRYVGKTVGQRIAASASANNRLREIKAPSLATVGEHDFQLINDGPIGVGLKDRVLIVLNKLG